MADRHLTLDPFALHFVSFPPSSFLFDLHSHTLHLHLFVQLALGTFFVCSMPMNLWTFVSRFCFLLSAALTRVAFRALVRICEGSSLARDASLSRAKGDPLNGKKMWRSCLSIRKSALDHHPPSPPSTKSTQHSLLMRVPTEGLRVARACESIGTDKAMQLQRAILYTTVPAEDNLMSAVAREQVQLLADNLYASNAQLATHQELARCAGARVRVGNTTSQAKGQDDAYVYLIVDVLQDGQQTARSSPYKRSHVPGCPLTLPFLLQPILTLYLRRNAFLSHTPDTTNHLIALALKQATQRRALHGVLNDANPFSWLFHKKPATPKEIKAAV